MEILKENSRGAQFDVIIDGYGSDPRETGCCPFRIKVSTLMGSLLVPLTYQEMVDLIDGLESHRKNAILACEVQDD